MDEPEKYVAEKHNTPALEGESGASEHIAKAIEYVSESMEEQKRAYEKENSALREKLRRYEDVFLKYKVLNEKKDEYIRRLQENARRYEAAREAATYEIERLKKETEELRCKNQEEAEALHGRLVDNPDHEPAEKPAAEPETVDKSLTPKTRTMKRAKRKNRAAGRQGCGQPRVKLCFMFCLCCWWQRQLS